MATKYFIYCRKSSEPEDKQMLSLPAQVKELIELAHKQGLTIVDANDHDKNECDSRVYCESKSAHWAGRPKFNAMRDRIRKGEANSIIIWDESRLARNAKDSGDIIYMMDLQQLVEIRKPGKVYHNTPDDKSWLAMCFMMSKKESDDKGVNVRRGLRTKAAEGWFPSSWTKPGYMWDRMAERGNKTLLNDPVRFSLIQQCWQLMLTGAYNVPQIWKKLNDEWGYRTPIRKKHGGKPMSISQLYFIFHDPFYYGYYQWTDAEGTKHWQKGLHQSMITQDEFDKVQVLLGGGCRQHTHKSNFSLTGIIHCGECGALVTADQHWQIICPECKTKFASARKTACPHCNIKIEDMTKPTILHYEHYHCTKRAHPNCTQKGITADNLEKQAAEWLGKVQISERFKNWAIKYLNCLNDEETVSHQAAIESLQNAYKQCVQRLDNLVKLKISPQNSDGSLLSDDEFKSQKQVITTEKEQLEEKLKIQGQRVTNWVEDVEQKFDFAIHARYRFETGTPEVKREMLVGLGSNLKLLDKCLTVDLPEEFFFIEKASKIEPSILQKLEPDKIPDRSIQFESLWDQNPALLPD